MEKKKNLLSLIIKLTVCTALIVLITVNYDYLKNLDIRKLADSSSSLPVTYATLLGVYCVKGLTMVIPASVVYIAVGMVLKTSTALILNGAGIIIEITVTYLLGRFLGGDAVMTKIGKIKNGEKIINLYEKYKRPGIFVIRFFGLPIDFCSLFFGAMKVPYAEYMLFSFIGIMPRVILFTILGDKVYDLIPMEYIIPAAITAAGAIMIFVLTKFIVNSVKKSKTEERE